MNRYQITGIIYIHIGMNEWVKRYTWGFPHKHCVFTAPDEHMPYIIQLHIMSIQPANKAAEHLISSEKKTEVVNAYCIKNSKGEGGEKMGGRGGREGREGGGGHSHKQSKDWIEFYGCIKQVSNDQSLQWRSLENFSLSLCLRETENWNSSSKTLFYKDCSLGSVKNPSNN